MFFGLKLKNAAIALLGSAILAFGMYHVHSFAQITEGGQLGLTLLLQHWFSLSPAISSFVFNVVFFFIGWRTFGKTFIACSAVCTAGFSLTFWICEQFPPLWPELVQYPLLAALLGAVFVGVGTGLCVRVGGAPSGDDALVMSIGHRFHIKLEYIYITFDVAVMLLSLTYIPIKRILFSLLSASLSSWLLGRIQVIFIQAEKS